MTGTMERMFKIGMLILTLQFMTWYSKGLGSNFNLVFYVYSILYTILTIRFTVKDFKIFYKGIKKKVFFDYKPLVVDLILLIFMVRLISITINGIFI